jgi:hypothetical protein
MTIQTPDQPFIKGPDVENPFNEHHDVDATHQAIRQMLADGTPNWVKFPNDYKSFVKESFAAEKDISNRMAAAYKWDDQEDLTNKAARQINKISTRNFVEHKLTKNGIKTVITDVGWTGRGGIPTVGLWCSPPLSPKKLRAVCFMDVPAMWEWSVLKLDSHGIPDGEASRGWRTVAIQLVEKEIITEAQCHRIFGVPSPNAISARYFRSLWEKRNGKTLL